MGGDGTVLVSVSLGISWQADSNKTSSWRRRVILWKIVTTVMTAPVCGWTSGWGCVMPCYCYIKS